jgi:hypothetical protein
MVSGFLDENIRLARKWLAIQHASTRILAA